MRNIFVCTTALLLLTGCILPKGTETVVKPASFAPEIAALKEVGVIEALTANGCLITKFKTAGGTSSRSNITAECNHIEQTD